MCAGSCIVLAHCGGQTLVKSNLFAKCSEHAIYAMSSSATSIKSNDISECSASGILVFGATSQPSIRGNQIRSCPLGIEACPGTQVLVVKNNLELCREGVRIQSQATVTNNRLQNIEGSAIVVETAESSILSNNDIGVFFRRISSASLFLSTSVPLTVFDHSFSVVGCGGPGIVLHSSSFSSVTNNKIKDVKSSHAVSISGTRDVAVRSNTFMATAKSAICLDGSSSGEIDGCTITHSSAAGITLNSNSLCRVVRCSVHHNEGPGIEVCCVVQLVVNLPPPFIADETASVFLLLRLANEGW